MNYLRDLLHQWQTPLSELAYYFPDFQIEFLEPGYLQAYSGNYTIYWKANVALQYNLPGQTTIYGPEHDLETLISKHNLSIVPTSVETSASDMINLLMTSDISEEVKTVLRRHIEFNNMRDLNVLKHVFAELMKTENPMALQILPLIK